MKHFLTFLFCAAILSANGQTNTDDGTPIYKKFPDVPPFTITALPDSSKFAKADLKRNRYTLIMIFSPDCEHCQVATEDMLAHFDKLKKVQIVMATPLEYRFIIPFYEKYQLKKYKNISIGRDPTYFLGQFYGVTNFPSIFLYDKKGKLIQNFEGSVSFEKIAEFLK